MKIGVANPPIMATGPDPIAIRDFVQAVEGMGFDHYAFAEHVVGRGTFHEALSLAAWLAGVTTRLELVSCMLLLPLRPAALVAKQAAEIDMLSGGRLRLGVSVSNFEDEYRALGVDFRSRGRRIEEQIEVMRLLWTQESVTYEGRFHSLRETSINPRAGRALPVWMGGGTQEDQVPSGNVLRRVGKYADGFIPLSSMPAERAPELASVLREAAAAEGRDPATLGLSGDISLADKTPDDWQRETDIWREAGASHLILRMRLAPNEQIEILQRYKDTVGLE